MITIKPTDIKCFVLDFDCTITQRHWYHFFANFNLWYSMYGDGIGINYESLKMLSIKCAKLVATIDNNHDLTNTVNNNLTKSEQELLTMVIMGSTIRLTLLQVFLAALKLYKFDLHVASRGLHNGIQIMLHITNLTKFFTSINAIDNKNNYISKDVFIQILINKNNYNVVYYIDDDCSEHKGFIMNLDLDQYKHLKYQFFGNTSDKYSTNINLTKNANGLDEKMIRTVLANINHHK